MSKACLELSSSGGNNKGVTTIYVESDNEDFIVAHLTEKEPTVTLDLNFVSGEKLCLKSNVSYSSLFIHLNPIY